MMIIRRLEARLQEAIQRSPSVALMGPRQVGKTTIALNLSEQMPAIYLDLENSLDALKVQDIVAYHSENRNRLIILDEVQRIPEMFAPLRGIIDKERRKGNKAGLFLFLGSASMDLLRQSGESLDKDRQAKHRLAAGFYQNLPGAGYSTTGAENTGANPGAVLDNAGAQPGWYTERLPTGKKS